MIIKTNKKSHINGNIGFKKIAFAPIFQNGEMSTTNRKVGTEMHIAWSENCGISILTNNSKGTKHLSAGKHRQVYNYQKASSWIPNFNVH